MDNCEAKARNLESILQIANKKDKFDHIIIETTGLAEPGPIISIFYTTELAEFMKVDGVVTMVDAKNVERHLDQETADKEAVNEALQQIAYADRVILNKTDLVRLSSAIVWIQAFLHFCLFSPNDYYCKWIPPTWPMFENASAVQATCCESESGSQCSLHSQKQSSCDITLLAHYLFNARERSEVRSLLQPLFTLAGRRGRSGTAGGAFRARQWFSTDQKGSECSRVCRLCHRSRRARFWAHRRRGTYFLHLLFFIISRRYQGAGE